MASKFWGCTVYYKFHTTEYDAAMLVGMSEKEYSDYMRDKTAVAKKQIFYKNVRYQVKANRPSGKKGSFVTMIAKTRQITNGTG